MEIELKVPPVGESISEVEIGDWLKKEGESVNKDENVVVLETDKATVEFPSPAAGKVVRHLKKKGDAAKIGEVIGYIDDAAKGGKEKAPEKKSEQKSETPPEPKAEKPVETGNTTRIMPAAARLI